MKVNYLKRKSVLISGIILLVSFILTIVGLVKIVLIKAEAKPYQAVVDFAANALESPEYLVWRQLGDVPGNTWTDLEQNWTPVQKAWQQRGITVTIQALNSIKDKSIYQEKVILATFETKLKGYLSDLVKPEQIKLNEIAERNANSMQIAIWGVMGVVTFGTTIALLIFYQRKSERVRMERLVAEAEKKVALEKPKETEKPIEKPNTSTIKACEYCGRKNEVLGIKNKEPLLKCEGCGAFLYTKKDKEDEGIIN